MKYYTLVIKGSDGLWDAEFGDYNKKVIKDEVEFYPRGATKIITTDDDQKSIDAAIAALNGK